MNIFMYILAGFSAVSALDFLTGSHFHIGREFERGILSFGTLFLSMAGMLVAAPFLASLVTPFIGDRSGILDFSCIPAMLFANDMGGASLAVELAADEAVGIFNGLIVASMMGCTVSFTIPYVMGTVDRQYHREVLTGLLCGIVTIPVGAFVGGLMLRIPLLRLLVNLLPLILFSAVIAVCLIFFRDICVKVFRIVGIGIRGIVILGLAAAIFTYLTGIPLLPNVGSFENAGEVVLNIMAVLTGAFPLLYLLSKVLKKPLGVIGKWLGINEMSALGLFSTLATSVTTYGNVSQMDRRGIVINSAFSVSAAFVFADHLAFTAAFCSDAIPAVIVSKLVAGATAVLVAGGMTRGRGF